MEERAGVREPSDDWVLLHPAPPSRCAVLAQRDAASIEHKPTVPGMESVASEAIDTAFLPADASAVLFQRTRAEQGQLPNVGQNLLHSAA